MKGLRGRFRKEREGEAGPVPAGKNHAEPSSGEKTGRWKPSWPLTVVVLAVLGYFGLFFTLSLLRFSNFREPGTDLAIYEQAIWLMSRGKSPFVTIRGMNIFGDHMVPILYFFVPLYWIQGKAVALLVVQTAALAIGALPLYFLGKRHLKHEWLAAAIGISYLLYPATQHMNLFDFHPDAFVIPFVLFAFYFLDKRKWIPFYVFCALTAMCKEDMALVVLLLAVVVYLRYDKRVGKILGAASLGYFLVSILLVIPLVGPEGFQYAGRLRQFGDNTISALKNMIIHPLKTLRTLATRTNLKYFVDLFWPVFFLPFLAPLFLLPALIPFGLNVISDFGPQHTIFFQYTAGIIPFVFIATIFGLGKLLRWMEGAARRNLVALALAFLLLASGFAANVCLGPSPISEAWSSSKYKGDKHIEAIREGLEEIPADAAVSSQTFLISHLSQREKIYLFPQPFVELISEEYLESLPDYHKRYIFPGGLYKRREKGENPEDYPIPEVEYVALDTRTETWPIPRKEYLEIVEALPGEGYEEVFSRDGVLILKRDRNPQGESTQ